MFDRDDNFKGIHANIVTQLTAEIDSESKFKGYEQEKEYINAYCNVTDIIIGMEGCE